MLDFITQVELPTPTETYSDMTDSAIVWKENASSGTAFPLQMLVYVLSCQKYNNILERLPIENINTKSKISTVVRDV